MPRLVNWIAVKYLDELKECFSKPAFLQAPLTIIAIALVLISEKVVMTSHA
jgi:hypothetical protein